MRRRCVPAWLLLGCGLLAGCSVLPLRRDGAGRSAPPAAPVAAAPRPGATTALLQEAAAAEIQGDTGRAAALLERAVRVAPHDPLPWNRLAALRLRQGQAAQAEQLAMKSNRLSGTQVKLQVDNWRIIAEGRRLAGDDAGARQAEQRLDGLDTP